MQRRCSRFSPAGWLAGVVMVWGTSGATAALAPREIPRPLPGHPGHIFLAGEEVTLRAPAEQGSEWRLLDYDGERVAEPRVRDGSLALGKLPVGFYRLEPQEAAAGDGIALGVLAPLRAPTPTSSPVALDVAMAWFYPVEKMPAVANLCALAGIHWVRDRLSWGQMEARRGEFAGPNPYDASARLQAEAGLRVLQVHHASPSWANPQPKRFPRDLRDTYRFHREMARRWAGQVAAFEPWNEADIAVFGGHTGSEMASLQKAAYLGLKAGNPSVIACWNVFASPRRDQLADVHENEAWPYFDTFNLHHYESFERYPALYAAFREVSAGRPLWVTECALPVKWTGDAARQEPSDADLRVQAERVAKTFALSWHEGAAATFYFLLPHYVEGQTQFGLLRRDLTPRPAFVALAAVGRWLADAQPLGRLAALPTQHAYLFRARPDGQTREVMVAWDEGGSSVLRLGGAVPALLDHLGRPLAQPDAGEPEIRLGVAPVFGVFPEGARPSLAVTPPPSSPARLAGRASPVVLQALWPEEQIVLNKSAYRLTGGPAVDLPVWIYNFGEQTARGRLEVNPPGGWKVALEPEIELAPGDRLERMLRLDRTQPGSRALQTLRLTGDFGPLGRPVLSLRFLDPGAGMGAGLTNATAASRWQRAVSGDGRLELVETNGVLVATADCGGSDRWVYPTLPLREDEIPPEDAEALGLTFTLLEGSGSFRAIFEEANGSAYVADFMTPPRPGETAEALAFFEGAAHGSSWSKPDPNHRLDAGQIRVVKVGCNTADPRVRFTFGNLRWVRFH